MTYDFVVIGAGSAGCVLTRRLVESGHSVLLLEAGPPDYTWDYRLHMPAALSHVLSGRTYNWFYESEPEPGLDQRRLYCPRGKTLGGSSSINGMIFVRGNPADFDRWAMLTGYDDWDYAHCLPYFRRSESIGVGSAEYRGREGPQRLTRGALATPLFDAFFTAGQEAGFPFNDDMNGADQYGVGPFDRSIVGGRRYSTATAFLRPVMNDPRLTVKTRCQVEKLTLDGQRVTGCRFRAGGQWHEVSAAETLVCAGAVDSPALLMRSGIGDPTVLAEANVPVRHELKGVGQNLQDHLEVYVQQACLQPVSLAPALKWYNQIRIGLQWYLTNTGEGATNHFEAGGFIPSGVHLDYPDIQYHFLPIAMNYDGSQKVKGHGFQLHTGPMKPTSRGRIRIRSASPADPPSILFNYAQTEADRQVMRKAIRTAREIFSQPGFRDFAGPELRPGADQQTDAELDQFVRQHGESAYHPSCSCRMGSDEMSVVDSHARVHGLSGIRIADASIMPEITNGNLNAPVIMIAEKVADAILTG
ncbi:MAG: choline dehydrogenase [Pseudomonadales bacterium]|nr:choline dehydrogenase [Pseudomonadales bacterium]